MNDDFEYKIYALFNNKTRQLTCFATDVDQFPESLRKNLLIKEFKLKDLGFSGDEINLARFKWEGDYDTGRLIDIVTEKKAVVSETEVNAKFFDMFWSRYNIYDVIQELILNQDMKTESGKSMKTFLEKVLQKKKTDVEFYKSSPLHIWESEETIKNRGKNAFG